MVPTANPAVGSVLTFRAVKNATTRSGAYVYAGTLIYAKVIRIRQGKLRARNGRTEPRVKEVLVGKSTKLVLQSFPGGGAQFNGVAKNLVVWPVHSVVTVVEDIYLVIGCSIAGGCEI